MQQSKIYKYFYITGVFCFLFLWDIKVDFYQPRFLIVLPLFALFFLKDHFLNNFKNNFLIVLIPFIITLHILILSFFYEYDLNKRDFFGLTLLLSIALLLTEKTKKIYLYIERSISLFVYIFVALYIFYILTNNVDFNINCYNGWFSNTKFFFVENSHFSIISVPIICFYFLKFCEIKKYESIDLFNLIFFLIFLIISFINFSTTFLLGLIVSLLFFIIKKYKNILFVIISLIIIFSSFIIITNYEQCNDRSFGSAKKINNYFKYKSMSELQRNEFALTNKIDLQIINMSIETYLVSLEITLKSLREKPFGIGFNKYYLSHNEYISKVKLLDSDIKKNNIYDGSNNFSKIITEFGLFGILIILILPFIYFRKKNISNIEYFLLILIGMQFLRGVGYFNGGYILAYLLVLKEFFKILLKKLNW